MDKVTQADVATRLGLHQTTVSAVLNNRSGAKIPEETRRRVLDAAEEMGYRPSLAARVLRRARSRAIGVIHSGCVTHQEVLKVMEVGRLIGERDYTPMVSDTLWFRQGVASACDLILDHAVEGVVLVRAGSRFPEEAMQRLLRAGIPLVAIEGVLQDKITQIVPDKRQGFYELMTHLIGVGHRRFALLGRWPDSHRERKHSPTAWAALDGIQDALREHELPADSVEVCIEDVWVPDVDDPYKMGKNAMQGILKRREKLPDCVLCTNDHWAVGAISACWDEGLTVPDDVAVTGFNNERLSDYCRPPLTTVAQPVHAMAREAVDRLWRMIEEEGDSQSPVTLALPCELVVRDSCGAVSGSKP